MCNPRVRPFTHFYPEDTGPNLSEARQGTRWLNELRPEETTFTLHSPGYSIWNGYGMDGIHKISICLCERGPHSCDLAPSR